MRLSLQIYMHDDGTLETSAQDPINFDADPDPESVLKKMDLDPDPDPGYFFKVY